MNMDMRFIKKISILFISIFILSIGADINLDNIFAKKIDKPILFFFHKDNCSFCEKMMFEFEDKNISNILNSKFIFLDIDRDDDDTILYKSKEKSNREFTKSVGIDFFPTLIFMDKNQNIIYSIVGYRNINIIRDTLKYIYTRAYNNRTFEEFEDELQTRKK